MNEKKTFAEIEKQLFRQDSTLARPGSGEEQAAPRERAPVRTPAVGEDEVPAKEGDPPRKRRRVVVNSAGIRSELQARRPVTTSPRSVEPEAELRPFRGMVKSLIRRVEEAPRSSEPSLGGNPFGFKRAAGPVRIVDAEELGIDRSRRAPESLLRRRRVEPEPVIAEEPAPVTAEEPASALEPAAEPEMEGPVYRVEVEREGEPALTYVVEGGALADAAGRVHEVLTERYGLAGWRIRDVAQEPRVLR